MSITFLDHRTYCTCRYPADRVPPHIGFKSRQRAGHASTRYHVSCNSGPHPPAEVGSGATTCLAALDLTSLPRWAPALPRVPWPWTLPPCRGGLQCCHMFCSSRPLLPVKEGSGAAVCPTASDPASLLGGLRCCHAPRDTLWAVGLRYKERLSWPSYVARLTCFHGV
jgi:hypothetical protein